MVRFVRRSKRLPRLVLLSFVAAGASAPPAALAGAAPETPLAAASASAAPAAVISTGALTGATFDGLGRVLSGVDIRVQTVDAETGRARLRTAKSDEAGRFVIDDLLPGLYRVIAMKGGYGVLVAQVNTLVEDGIDLVLRPSAAAGVPGSRPEDARWALRLPSRDPLEDRGPSLDPERAVEDAALSGGRSIPVQLELRAGQAGPTAGTDDSFESTGAGLAGSIETAFAAGAAGHVGVAYGHRREGEQGLDLDRNDRVGIQFVPSGDGPLPVRFRLDAGREARERTASGSSGGPFELASDTLALQSAWESETRRGRLGAFATIGAVSGIQDTRELPEDDGTAEHAAAVYGAGVSGERRRSARRTSYGMGVSASPRSGWDRPGADSGAIPADLLTREGDDALASLADYRIDARVATGWRSAPLGARITTAARVEHAEWEGLGATRAAGGVSAAWTLPHRVDLEIAGGVAQRGTGSDEALWSATLGSQGRAIGWFVARSHGTGLSPWDGAGGVTRGANLGSAVVTDRDGEIDRWSASGSWRIRPDGLRLSLTGERYEMNGRLAARLDGDLPWVSVAENGAARGLGVGLAVSHAGRGTKVDVAWRQVEDVTAAGVLFGGAETVELHRVDVRQELGGLGFGGALWQVVVGYEQSRIDDGSAGSGASPRLAILDHRRVSGGVAVAF